jgi:hypothetical protein
VHRALEQQKQRRGAYIASSAPRAATHVRIGSEAASTSATTSLTSGTEPTPVAVVVVVIVIVFVGSGIHGVLLWVLCELSQLIQSRYIAIASFNKS